MESSRELSRKAFAAAAFFEASLVGVAVLLANITGTRLFPGLKFDLAALGIGVVATLPLCALLVLFIRSEWRPLRRIRESLDTTLVPLFRNCTWDELLALALLAGVGEEMLFRGWLQVWISETTDVVSGLLMASLAFGLVHAVTPAYAILAGGIGLYLGGVLLVTDNLLAPIVVHALYDFVAFWVVLRRAD